MRSPHGERLARLAQAIDELAAHGLADLPPDVLAERVTHICTLVEGIDPESTRRRAYTPRVEN
ncbi:hypothetical protein [Actinocorallia populi]|uniref:hypothetical protein n=1 Tax=Actinocorallia populi TaxID=2079200 RepID=UPI000D095302|nr:hypothetical protein [Actinocorallia populi]